MSSRISYLNSFALRTPSFDYIAPSKDEFKEGLRKWCDEKLGSEEYDNRKIALTIMENCYHYNWEEISLANLGLSSIPEQICALESLEVLDLGQNKIKALPFNLHQLTKLKQLNLDDNPMKSLPVGILCLPNRCKISLEGCDQLDPSLVESIEKNQNSLHREGRFRCHGHCADFKTDFEDPIH